METLRTPDERFSGLPGFRFEPHYAEVADPDGGTLRVHYLDEGPADGQVVLLLHGEPSWSFLYRTMVPVLVDAGLRVVAPDLVGFGRSDKPTPRTEYTYARHVEWMRELLFDRLDLRDVTLVCQDWGGLVGLRLVGEHPDRFARVVAANTYLPTGDTDPGEAFRAWRTFSQEVEEFPTGAIVNMGCTTDLAPEVIAAYDAPFPDQTYVEGARQFPLLVPATPDDPASEANRAAWTVLEQFEKPFLTAFSDGDPITAGAHRSLHERIPGARGREHVTIEGGGHFLQEDRGPELAAAVVAFVARHLTRGSVARVARGAAQRGAGATVLVPIPKEARISPVASTCRVVSPTPRAGSAPGQVWPPPVTVTSCTGLPGAHPCHSWRTTWVPIRLVVGRGRQRSRRAHAAMFRWVPLTFTPGSDRPTAPSR